MITKSVSGKDIDYTYAGDGGVESVLKKQNSFLWFLAVKEGVVPAAGSKGAPFGASSEDKEQVPVACGIKEAMTEFAFPFLWQAPAMCRQIHYICAREGLPAFLHFFSPS